MSLIYDGDAIFILDRLIPSKVGWALSLILRKASSQNGVNQSERSGGHLSRYPVGTMAISSTILEGTDSFVFSTRVMASCHDVNFSLKISTGSLSLSGGFVTSLANVSAKTAFFQSSGPRCLVS